MVAQYVSHKSHIYIHKYDLNVLVPGFIFIGQKKKKVQSSTAWHYKNDFNMIPSDHYCIKS